MTTASNRQQILAVPNSLDGALAKDFAGVPQVAEVFIQRDGDTVRVWISLDDVSDDEVRFRIYDKELSAMEAFPAIQFDFNLIPTMGRPIREFISEPGNLVFARH